MVDLLLDKDIRLLRIPNARGMFPFFKACEMGHADCVSAFLKHFVEPLGLVKALRAQWGMAKVRMAQERQLALL